MKTKRHFSVLSKKFSTILSEWLPLINDYKYNVKCMVESEKVGFFRTKYFITVEGEEQNIDNFIEYLKHEGFKVC